MGKKEKGFIFSIDAMFAIVLVVLLSGLFMAYYAVQEPSMHALGTLERKAADRAIVALYLGTYPDPRIPSMMPDATFTACAYVFYLEVVQVPMSPVISEECEFL